MSDTDQSGAQSEQDGTERATALVDEKGGLPEDNPFGDNA